jgi:hypothetical protein
MFADLEPLRHSREFLAREGMSAVEGRSAVFVQSDDPEEREEQDLPAAGWPVFAQFLAHDLTADRSPLGVAVEVADLRNARHARLDLECVYGLGPADQPYLVQREAPSRMLVGGDVTGPDLPRNQEGTALVGDPRNDVHTLIAQLHVRLLQVHNAIEDRLRQDGVAAAERFARTQRELRWHYQWVVLHDYLPVSVGPALADAVRAGDRRVFVPTGPVVLPVEFADAAFRYGHSQIRSRYRLQVGGDARPLFPDLVGFRPVGDRRVDLALLFDLPTDRAGTKAQRAKRIDGRLAESLIHLPVDITGELEAQQHQSLAVRDLERGLSTGLPSGEAVARHLGQEPLTPDEVGVTELGWEGETPLWYYVLKEAQVRADGRRLGPVGGRMVAEVLCAVIEQDPTSYMTLDPRWSPTLPHDGVFTLGHLLDAGR